MCACFYLVLPCYDNLLSKYTIQKCEFFGMIYYNSLDSKDSLYSICIGKDGCEGSPSNETGKKKIPKFLQSPGQDSR